MELLIALWVSEPRNKICCKHMGTKLNKTFPKINQLPKNVSREKLIRERWHRGPLGTKFSVGVSKHQNLGAICRVTKGCGCLPERVFLGIKVGKAGGKDLFSQALSESQQQKGDVSCASCWQQDTGDTSLGSRRGGGR